MIDLYEKRLIVMIENDQEDGGGFSQVIFDRDQFKKVSAAILGCFPSEKDTEDTDIDWFDMQIDDSRVMQPSLFEGMRSCE